MRHPLGVRGALSAYAVLGTATIVAHLVGAPGVVAVSSVVMMPLLWLYLRGAMPSGSRIRRRVLVALVMSWFGDWAGWWLPLKISFFLLAQLAYLRAFWPYRRRSLLVRPVPLAAYGAGLGPLITLVAAHAGPLAAPVAIYGVGVGLMAVLATGVNRAVGTGALLFLLSDIELAVYLFVDPDVIPASAALNSLLYLPAQLLIVVGVVRCATAETQRPEPVLAPARG